MKGIIMMGGYGTRLEPLTLRTPKALLPVGGKPNIDYLIEKLKLAEIDDIIISANTTNKKVQDYISDEKITFVLEKTNSNEDKLGVVGAIKYLKGVLGTDDYLILAGDNFFHGFDIKAFKEYHLKNNPSATIGLYQLEDKSDVQKYGIAVMDEKNRIVSFQEKPKPEEAMSKLASTFIQLISSNFIENHLEQYIDKEISRGRKPDQIGNMWESYSKDLKIMGKDFRGFWGDIGDVKIYLKINRVAMESIESKDTVKGVRIQGEGIKIGKDVVFGNDVKVRGPVIIENGTVIKDNVVIGPHVHIMKNSVIGERTMIEDTIIFEKTEIGNMCRLTSCVVDGEAKIGDESSIEPGVIIGFQSKIGRHSKIFSDAKIWPFMSVSENSVISGKLHWPIIESKKRDDLINSCYWK